MKFWNLLVDRTAIVGRPRRYAFTANRRQLRGAPGRPRCNAANNNAARRGLRGWWASPPRSGMQRLIDPWDHRHLRAFGVTRIAGAFVAATAGVVCLSYAADVSGAFFLVLGVLNPRGWLLVDHYRSLVTSPEPEPARQHRRDLPSRLTVVKAPPGLRRRGCRWSSPAHQRRFIRHGLAIGTLPRSLIETTRDITLVPIRDHAPQFDTSIAIPANRRLSAAPLRCSKRSGATRCPIGRPRTRTGMRQRVCSDASYGNDS